jgi:DNA-binding NtrC family response regulator
MMEHPIAASAEAVSGKGWETILLVEDEAFVREVTGEVLASAGYTVLKAGNAEEALWTFCRHEGEVHLLLTDVVMPGKSGRDLAAELRSLSPGMKTIVTSGYSESVALLDGGQDSSVSFLAKPFSVQSLMQKIREMLDENQ